VFRRRQRPGLGIDSEDNDGAASLVGDEAEGPGWIDVEIPRGLDLGLLMLDEGQRSLCWIDPIDGDAVVPAIGAIEKLAIWMHAHLGAGTVPFEVIRQGRNRLDRP